MQILFGAAILVAAKLAFDFTSVLGFIYRGTSLDQPVIAVIFISAAVLAVFILVVMRLVQKRFLEAVILAGLCVIPFVMPPLLNAPYLKFKINKAAYQKAIEVDSSPSPKYKVFSWGNDNISLGGGIIYRVIVYDEADNIIQDPRLRLPEWRGNPGLSLPEDRWITAEPPDCRRRTDSFGDHFYYVTQSCT